MADEKVKRTDVNTLGEFGLIDHITRDFSTYHPTTTRKSIGDDAAVLKNHDENTIVSTDMLVEGIHFDLMYTPLKHLGYKAVVVNLSDLVAMNVEPTHITFSLAISNRFSVEAVEELYEGIKQACDFYKVDLVGGDTTSSPKGMILSVTAIGQSDDRHITYRNGAKPGNIICVTGHLGSAYLGLQILEREKQIFLDNPDIQPDLGEHNTLIERLLKPEARLDAIKYMRKEQLKPTAMMDISDGLASELFHICQQSQVGAHIEEAKVPIHPSAEQQAIDFRINPITCALSGGEDYELLFTIDEQDIEKIRYMPDVNIIGEIVPKEDGIKLITTSGNFHDIKAQGWVHF